ncbi:MAG: hypothetical protein K0Q55_598 [Verrucomicrobia bacterium]|jgi:hypothetical protein|nr:hypothetical protein [Verrucomicrobiota bacterium]
MTQGGRLKILLAMLSRRWKQAVVLLVVVLVFIGPRLFANPESVFVRTFNTELPKDGKGRLLEFESSKHSSMFVFEGNFEFLRSLERQVLPRWEQIKGRKPDNIFEVPGAIRKHKLFAESAKKLQWVYVGQTSGRSDGDMVFFCTDLDSRAWVMSLRMEGGLSPMISLLNKVFWVALGIYLLCRYWSPKQHKTMR